MTINTRMRDAVVDDLITTDTTEQTFRNAIRDVAFQSDTTDLEVKTTRTLTAEGPVLVAETTFNLNDIDKGIMLTTTLGPDIIGNAQIADGVVQLENMAANSVNTTNIVDGAITTAKIGVDQITGTHVNIDASRKLIISNAGGIELFSMYGFRTVT